MTQLVTDVGEQGVKIDERLAIRASVASFVGTAMEWYDFYLFSTAAALVFGTQFFSGESAWVALMSSFATFAIGFVARPIGGVVFGILGDRIGRRAVLMITIFGIGGVTALIGLLPTVAQIGLWAPTLLATLRFLQGLAVGGEWSGAVTYATEHAPKSKRAWYAVLPQFGSPIGTVLSAGAFSITAALTTESFFTTWGWRIPFLLAVPLLIVAYLIRRNMEESPVFEEIKEERTISKAPLVEVFRTHFPQIIVGFLVSLVGIGGFYVVTTFAQSYGKRLGLSVNLLLFASMIGAVGEALILWAGGRLGVKFGPSRVAIVGSVISIIVAFPVFLMLVSKNPVLVVLGIAIGVTAVSIPYAAQGAILTALFPPSLRLSGVTSATNIGAIFSGFMPLIATALVSSAGGAWWPASVLLITISALTLIAAIIAPHVSIKEVGIQY